MKTITGYEAFFSKLMDVLDVNGVDTKHVNEAQLEILSRVSVPIARNLATYLRCKFENATESDIDALISYVDDNWNFPAPDATAVGSAPDAELVTLHSGQQIIKDLEYLQVVVEDGRATLQVADFMSAIIRQSLEEIAHDPADIELIESTQAAIELVYLMDDIS